jgi:hypothetical protein
MVDYQTISIVFTGLSISLAAFYYISTLRNTEKTQRQQLETRKAQLFMSIYSITIDEEMNKRWYDAMEMRTTDFHEVRVTMHTLFQKYNGIGHLMMQGLIDVESAYHYSEGYRAVLLWLKWGDHIKGARSGASNPDYLDGFEYMAKQMMQYRDKQGLPNELLPQFQS